MGDELSLDLEDIVHADQTFDDGWALGKNVNKGTIGAFPLACCVPLNEDGFDDRNMPPPQRGKANVRSSSLFQPQTHHNVHKFSNLQDLLKQNRIWAKTMKDEDPQFFDRLRSQQTPQLLWIGCSDSR